MRLRASLTSLGELNRQDGAVKLFEQSQRKQDCRQSARTYVGHR